MLAGAKKAGEWVGKSGRDGELLATLLMLINQPPLLLRCIKSF